MSSSKRLVAIGLGYVGLPLAVHALEAGWSVVGIDIDQQRVRRLLDADSYVEDVSSERLAAALEGGRFAPTSSYAAARGFDVAVITVPTRMVDGTPDLSSVLHSARSLAPYVRRGSTIVLESTTYPGTTEEVLQPVLERSTGMTAGTDFYLGYSPERVDPGNRHWNIANTPKIVSGVGAESLKAIAQFYGTFVHTTVSAATCREAEFTKLVENLFRQVNIAVVNELAMAAEELGLSIWRVLDIATTKPFGYMRFSPGPGVGGHCLPNDPLYLSWHLENSTGRRLELATLAKSINDEMPSYVTSRIGKVLGDRGKSIGGSRVVVLGLSYKKNVGDIRESPAVRVAEMLAALGADVRVADPHVDPSYTPTGATRIDLVLPELTAADAAVLLVDHDAFDYGLLNSAGCPVLDTRGRLDAAGVYAL